MRLFFAFILLTAIAYSSIFGLIQSENEKFIQGKWRLKLPSAADLDMRQRETTDWKFENGTFSSTGNSPFLGRGRYRVLAERENSITLRLYQDGKVFATRQNKLEIVIDKAKSELKIAGQQGFNRIL